MFEKVNPSHPDKVADRIAGALVDLAYDKNARPKIAVEVLIGHGLCTIISESSVFIPKKEVASVVNRIVGYKIKLKYIQVPQDRNLANNQEGIYRCGDNGIFKGTPVALEQQKLTDIAHDIYNLYPYDGKYLISNDKLVICQSNAETNILKGKYRNAKVNPLGYWKGGINVDSGATNRKLGSDMGDSVTGGGLHGKDLSKADVSVNIYAFIKAQETGKPVEISCAIGDDYVDGKPFGHIVLIAKEYIKNLGGFEKFAEWGLIR